MKQGLTIILLSSLFFFSCTKSPDYQALYDDKQYEALLTQTSQALHDTLSKDALYYKAMCAYQLGYMDEAASSARLYLTLYPKPKRDQNHNLKSILLYFGTPEEARAMAADLKDDNLTKAESIRLFQLLVEDQDEEAANELYVKMRQDLTNREAALMVLSAKASTSLIVTTLEGWYSENNAVDEEFQRSLLNALDLLLSRKEGEGLLSLSLAVFNEENQALALRLGDIYSSLGERDQALSYWSKAQSAYPIEVRSRLFTPSF